jgi:hypothetical protein
MDAFEHSFGYFAAASSLQSLFLGFRSSDTGELEL